MQIVMLGSGTSSGVPVIGCSCEVCRSDNPRNRRTRASMLLRLESGNILVDTATDFRAQALANAVERVDAVMYTHTHADHIHGIDDLRCFNKIMSGPIPCYASPRSLENLKASFGYIFKDADDDGWRPNLEARPVTGPFDLLGLRVEPVEIIHNNMAIYGYRFGDVAYITDCSGIPQHSVEKLKGLDMLILGALRYTPHPSHFSLAQALEAIEMLRPGRAVLTHLGHVFDYEKTSSELPAGVALAYDGMKIEI